MYFSTGLIITNASCLRTDKQANKHTNKHAKNILARKHKKKHTQIHTRTQTHAISPSFPHVRLPMRRPRRYGRHVTCTQLHVQHNHVQPVFVCLWRFILTSQTHTHGRHFGVCKSRDKETYSVKITTVIDR